MPTTVIEQSAARFSALREPTPDGDVPAEIRQLAGSLASGASATTYRVAARPALSLYVFKAADQLCYLQALASGARAGGCFLDPEAVARGAVGPMVTKVEGGYRLVAFVPDGTADPLLRWEHGPAKALEIEGNVVAAFVERLPESVEWIAPDGSRTTSRVGADLFDVRE